MADDDQTIIDCEVQFGYIFYYTDGTFAEPNRKEGAMKKCRIISFCDLIKIIGILLLAGLVVFPAGCGKTKEKSQVVQHPLPYKTSALEPYISDRTLSYHYGEHYATYVKKSNRLLKQSDLPNMSVEEMIAFTYEKDKYKSIFNNVAQAWNHAFFWKCLKPGGGTINAEVADRIIKSFGSFDKFKQKFLEAAKSRFGSGWTWLVLDGDKLKIVTTGNADTPIAHGLKPLFTVDIWEHAYYLDYQNRRADYVRQVLNHLVNWDFIASRLKSKQA